MQSKDVIDYFAKLIVEEIGIVYSDVNHYQLEMRLKDVAKQLGFDGIEGLYQAAHQGVTPEMKLLLLDTATNNETMFFRDPAVFAAIESEILGGGTFPPRRSVPLRVWSAACSTGQEPYSLAMLLEKHRSRLPGGSYEIVATDISDRVLRQAESGTYSQLQVQRGLAAPTLVQHFEPAPASAGGLQWQVKPALRRMVTFKKLNLLKGFEALGRFDLILCRNVLIYQAPESKRRVIARLHAQLDDQGYLILGAAESLIGLSSEFEMVRTEKATVYRKLNQLRKAC